MTMTYSTISTTAMVVITPVVGRTGHFTTRCDGRLLCRSRQPLFDGARELLASGYPADALRVLKRAAEEGGSAIREVPSAGGAR
jgi:hypothetical protein